MKKVLVVTIVSAILVLSFFGCSENRQDPEEVQTVFLKTKEIKNESFLVEQALQDILDMERGEIVSRYEGTFSFGDVTAYDNVFEKLSDDNYYITYTAIDKDGNREVVNATEGTAENIFGNQLMVKDFQKVLDSMEQLEIIKENYGSIFKYSYTLKQSEEANSLGFVGVKAHYFYLLDSKGSLKGMEQHVMYKINDGEEHHDFIKTTISETLQ